MCIISLTRQSTVVEVKREAPIGPMKDLKKKIAEGNRKKIDIVVSYPFHNKEKDTYLYVVIFPKANKTFYAKPEHFRQAIEIFYERKMIGNVNKLLKWLSTIDGIKIRKKEHGEESLFHRSGPKNNTTDQIMFVVSVPAEDKGSASTIVEKCTNYFSKLWRSANTTALERLHLLIVRVYRVMVCSNIA